MGIREFSYIPDYSSISDEIIDLYQWIGFSGNILTGKPPSGWENRWFPLDFPFNQSIEYSNNNP